MLMISTVSALLILSQAVAPVLSSPISPIRNRDSGVISSRSSKGVPNHGAVATEVAECSKIGIEMLKQGGAAADAIIAAGLCVGTIAAYHSGIGGGGFMIIRAKNESNGPRTYEMIDFRETMPALGNETMYAADAGGAQKLSTVGGLAVGVPGELRGWELLHQRHGKLPWKSLFQPAINLARNGFNCNFDLAYGIQQGADFILKDPLWSETYAPNGTLLVEGDTIYRKRYANTLEGIANNGAKYLYSGKIADNIVKASAARGGIISNNDLAGYKAVIREPVSITYRNSRIFSTVAPSSGAVVLSALKIFEGFPGNYSDDQPEINITTHRLIQGTEFAYGQRTQYGDPAFVPNVTELQKYYLQEDVVKEIQAKITNRTHGLTYYDPLNYTATRESGTSHMAVIDKNGSAVSLTTTVNTYWGSQVMTEDGIILNNEMDDFSSPGQVNSFGFAASPANYIRPGKRPLSSIASSISEDLKTGQIQIATGSAGGSRIITATLQHLYHHLDQNLNAYECVHHPRWHDQLSGQTYFEYKDEAVGIAGYNNATVDFLAGLGYNVTYEPTSGSTGHVAIRTKNGTFAAASDPRKRAGGGFAF